MAQKKRKENNTKVSRRSQEDRRREAKDKILRSTIDTLSKEGYSKLTISMVSKGAKVSQGALLNYFPSKRSLIKAAASYALVKILEDTRSEISNAEHHADPLDVFLAYLDKLYSQPNYMASVELASTARSDRILATDYALLLEGAPDEWTEEWVQFFVDHGCSRLNAETLVDLTNHVMTGTIVYSFAPKSAEARKRVQEEWSDVARKIFFEE